jgi:hypothetical protein
MKNSKVRYQRRDASEWREVIKRQAESSLSIEAFCEREGIAKSSFGKWRRSLKKERKPSKKGFIELLPEKPEQTPLRVEIQFPNGSILRVC